MQAVVLAGGKGTRLKPYTITIPKSLVPINDTPILEIIIKQLRSNGFRKIILAVGHQAELIQAYFQNGEKYGVKIDYSIEDQPMGTAGPLKNIKNLDEHFLVLNSDDLTDLDYGSFFELHKKSDTLLTIASYSREIKIDLGVIEENDSILTNYIEKPIYNFKVSTGIYAFKRDVLDYIPDDEYYDFPQLVKTLLANKKSIRIHEHHGYWLDIGRPEDYERATNEINQIKTIIKEV
jgi:NDP-mannose synthase